jgi:hypothetical protein
MKYMIVFLGICTAILIGFNAGSLVYSMGFGSEKNRLKLSLACGILLTALSLLQLFS